MLVRNATLPVLVSCRIVDIAYRVSYECVYPARLLSFFGKF